MAREFATKVRRAERILHKAITLFDDQMRPISTEIHIVCYISLEVGGKKERNVDFGIKSDLLLLRGRIYKLKKRKDEVKSECEM